MSGDKDALDEALEAGSWNKGSTEGQLKAVYRYECHARSRRSQGVHGAHG